MQKIQFDYFTGMEAEQYSFYRVPKVLFTEPCFKALSCEAKVLYGLMLDRMSLSIKNRWLDSEDKVYIIFTVEEIAELMNCGTHCASLYFACRRHSSALTRSYTSALVL